MADERLADVLRVCREALAREDGERVAYLDAACGGDVSLRAEVEALLAEQRGGGAALLDTPPWQRPAPALAAGHRLGRYEIQSAIGAGGMGQVYKARDTRLNRTVAIKVLPPDVATDPDRLARFEREAKTVAALNDARICVLHDVGEHEGSLFLVMEYLSGSTLADRLKKGPLPVEQAMAVAAEIADGLSAAHREGVVHRDLKPANVMLTKSGVKLLDFGLAKLKAHREPPAATGIVQVVLAEAQPLTGSGVIVGTLHYMAPEQLQGKPADARADLWALGAIIYEMLTGRRAFEGTSAIGVISAIMEREPTPIASLSPLTPPALDRLVRRCLAKQADDRPDGAHDIAEDLRWLQEGAVGPGASDRHQGSARARSALRVAPLVAAGIVLLAAAIWLWRQAGHSDLGRAPRLVNLTSLPGYESSPALSPDGRQVAFQWAGEDASNVDIYVEVVGETDAHRVTKDPLVEAFPSWSPDGGRIAFQRCARDGNCGIYTISSRGGGERKITDVRNANGLGWSPDGRWLAVARGPSPSADTGDAAGIGIYLVSTADGATRVRMTEPGAPIFDRSPRYSPNGRFIGFVRCTSPVSSEVFVQRLTPDGLPDGEPRQVTRTAMVKFGVAWDPDSESIIFSGQQAFLLGSLYRVSISGNFPPSRIELAGSTAWDPSTSAGGHRLAFRRSLADLDIYRFHAARPWEPVVRSTFAEYSPQFSPDGLRLSFASNRNGESQEIWTANADGSEPVQLTHGPGLNQGTPAWSADGRWIVFDSQAHDGQFDIYAIPSAGGRPQRITFEQSNEHRPSFARDGKWIYFASDRSGRFEIWRTRFPAGTAEQVTREGGIRAFESMDGKTLIYTKATREVFAKPLDGRPERRVVDFVRSDREFAVAAKGIYYWGRVDERDRTAPFMVLDLASGAATVLARSAPSGAAAPLPPSDRAAVGISVSPDGKTILCTMVVGSGSDVMMIENFR